MAADLAVTGVTAVTTFLTIPPAELRNKKLRCPSMCVGKPTGGMSRFLVTAVTAVTEADDERLDRYGEPVAEFDAVAQEVFSKAEVDARYDNFYQEV